MVLVSVACEAQSEMVSVQDSCGSLPRVSSPCLLPPVILDILEVRQKPILMT